MADSSTYSGQALGPFSRALVEAEFEIKWPRTERIESLEVVPATVEVLMVMSPTLLTLWIHGILALVKLTSHLCRETEEQDVITIEPSNNSVKYTTVALKHTWVGENFFGLSDVYKLLLCLFLFFFILEVVWMPLLCHLSVCFQDLFLLCGSATTTV